MAAGRFARQATAPAILQTLGSPFPLRDNSQDFNTRSHEVSSLTRKGYGSAVSLPSGNSEASPPLPQVESGSNLWQGAKFRHLHRTDTENRRQSLPELRLPKSGEPSGRLWSFALP